ncbi:MAG: hypothetical protein COB08_005535 [Rhodobacteraceae bacterium]|nr:hypothetical protein [Paracoccaceae bacterium]
MQDANPDSRILPICKYTLASYALFGQGFFEKINLKVNAVYKIMLTTTMLLFGGLAMAQETLSQKVERTATLIDSAIQRSQECRLLMTYDGSNEGFTLCMEDVSQLRSEAEILRSEIELERYNWILEDDGPSPIDDSPTLTLAKLSQNQSTCGLGSSESYLVLRCLEGNTSLFFQLNRCTFSDVGDTGSTGVLRIGSAPAMQIEVIGRNSMFLPNVEGGAIPLITSMFGQQRLVFRAQPFNSPQQTIVFDITGLEEAITPLREACHW